MIDLTIRRGGIVLIYGEVWIFCMAFFLIVLIASVIFAPDEPMTISTGGDEMSAHSLGRAMNYLALTESGTGVESSAVRDMVKIMVSVVLLSFAGFGVLMKKIDLLFAVLFCGYLIFQIWVKDDFCLGYWRSAFESGTAEVTWVLP